MDEIEFKTAYNAACTAAERVATRETKAAIQHVLALVNALNERITELQEQSEDE